MPVHYMTHFLSRPFSGRLCLTKLLRERRGRERYNTGTGLAFHLNRSKESDDGNGGCISQWCSRSGGACS